MCDATVNEFEFCTNEQAAAFRNFVEDLPDCESVMIDDLERLETDPELPESCDVFDSDTCEK